MQVLRFFGTSEQQPHGLFLASGDFADGDAVAALPGQGALQVVLAGSAAAPRQNLLDARAAVRHAGRVVGAAAIHAQHRAGRDVAVCGDGQIDGERCAGGRGHALFGDGNGKPGRRWAADDRPRQPGARRLHSCVLRHHLQAIEAGDRIAQDEPLDVVAAGSRGRVAACRGLRLGAIGVPVHPQVQIVQHRLRQRIRRRLVPGQRDVQAASPFRHLDVLIAVFAIAEFQRRAAGRPAVRRIPAQHAGARRDLAQTVLVLQFSRAVAGVQRELGGVVEEGVWPDGAGDEPGAHRRRLLAELWHRVHQQRGDASHRRRGHAGAAGFRIAAAGTTAGGGDEPHAGADDLRPQAPVQRRALAAEAGDVAFPGRRADRQRILRGSVVAAPTEVGVASRDDVDLAMPPHGGVQLAFVRRAPFPVQAVAAQAHVHDQGLGRLAAAGRRFGKEVDALADGHGGGRIGVSKHLPEADVARQRGHAGVARLDSAVADDGAGNVGAVADDVHPQIAVLVARRADAAGHEVGTADARPPACDVRMVNVQAGVEHAHWHGRASAAGEQARRRIEAPQRIRAHRRHRRVVGRPEDADWFHRKHEVRRDQRRERAVGNVGGIGARIRVEAPNHGAEVGERLAPSAVWIVRHQRDEGRRLFQGTRGRQLKELRGGLGGMRRGSDAGNAGQVGDLPQLRIVRRQPRPQQAATAPEHLAAQGRQSLRDPFDIRGRRRADPAEGPIAAVRACSLRR